MNAAIDGSAGFVLVHGGGMGPWIWERLLPLLRSPAHAVSGRYDAALDPRRVTVADCVEHVVAEVDRSGLGRVILVGHSIAGVLLPGVAARRPGKVKHLVFVAASVPPEGRRAIDVLPFGDRIMNRVALLLQRLGVEAPRETLERMIREHFCNASSEDVVSEVLARPVLKEPQCLAFERVSRKDMPDLPLSFVRLLADRTASLETQDRLAAALGRAVVRSIDADHMVMLSRPEELAALLNDVAASVASPAVTSARLPC